MTYKWFIVPQKDILELSKTINKLIENEDLRKRLALNGYEMVKGHFSWKQIAKDYIEIYKEILNNCGDTKCLKYDYFNSNPFSVHKKIIDFVGKNKKVLDVGCSEDYYRRE